MGVVIGPGDIVYSPAGLAYVYALCERLVEAGPDEWVEGAIVWIEGEDDPDDPPTWFPLWQLELAVGTFGEGNG